MSNIAERLTQSFLNVFPDLDPVEAPRASMASLASWDSVAHVTLLASVSEEFGTSFEGEDYEQLTSYALILDTLQQSQGKA
jgi:acyl carrier protein